MADVVAHLLLLKGSMTTGLPVVEIEQSVHVINKLGTTVKLNSIRYSLIAF